MIGRLVRGAIDGTWPLVRAGIFSFDAEVAHEGTVAAAAAAPGLLGALIGAGSAPAPGLGRDVGGVRWAGPVGLAAGLDKDGTAIPFWAKLGFGSVEVGTVTAHPQPGNDKPRLFRLPADHAVINRMGFNNHGSEAMATRLRALREAGRWPSVPVGVNVGKSKVTPLEDAVDDYVTSIRRMTGLGDWFTVNVSSPNTPGLRSLQDRAVLERLLPAALEAAKGTPVWLKLAPDLDDDALRDAVHLGLSSGLAGIIATNTTLTRPQATPTEQAGGLSGAPLWPLARAKIGVVLEASAGRLPVIGVGGISTAAQVDELLKAGCAAVQLYTAFIYEGPGLPSRLHRGLAAS